MPPDKQDEADTHHVTPDRLAIGLYIYVDLPWFLHPFTRSSFKIASAEQIADLRGLGVQRFRYDPARSDTLPVPVESAAPTMPAPEADETPKEAAGIDPAAQEKLERQRRQQERRISIAQMEKNFVKAAGVMRRVTRNALQRPLEVKTETEDLADQMASVFLGQTEVSLHVMGEKCGGEEAYFHGLNVAILSLMLAKGLELSGEQARQLGAGALLHDIGRIEIPDRVLMKSPDEFTRAERELHARHVEFGMRIGKSMDLGADALGIIAQHHEMADGSGYPGALKSDQIAPLARVVCLANHYDNLCNPVMPSQAMTPHEALSFIFARCRDKFDAKVLQLMIRSLGVYPPGSLVKLSSDAIAMVVSVNPKKALRPWVLLYDAGVPKDRAVMLDLEHEPGVSIAKSLRPSALPPAVHAYLSPRRRITYFFDSEAAAVPEPA